MDYQMLSIVIGLEAMRRGALPVMCAQIARDVVEHMRFGESFVETEYNLHRTLMIIDEQLTRQGWPLR